MSVATRRASLTPSSPAVSRRGSWVDLPAGSAPSSRRGSRVDLSATASSSSSTNSDSCAPGSHSTKLSINQLLSNLSHVSESQARMSSPKGSRSPALSESQSTKRKHEPDTEPSSSSSMTALRLSSASEIHLPTDPVRRASIINLATAAAAAVLQSQAGQRRMSAHPEQEQKRQRVEHLGMLIEQARKASVTSLSHDMSRHVETASQNVAIATVLANHLGLTPQSSAASTPSAGTPAPSSPTKAHASSLAIPQTPTTPKSPLSAAPVTAAHVSDDRPSLAQDATAAFVRAVKDQDKASQQMPAPPSPTNTPAITLTNSTESAEPGASSKVLAEPLRESPSPPASSQAIFDRAKEAAHTYSRFYRFEKEWAQKALELERRRSSIRIDPLFNPNPSLSPLPADAHHEDKGRGPTSPQQRSAPESRIVSRGTSPFGDLAGASAARTSHSVPSGSFSSSHRGSSSSLANVLSNFAELIEHRQRSCSGLEALAKQAKELPVKRLSQPNPQFRTTFGDFSWAKTPRSATDPTATSTAAPMPAAAVVVASPAPLRSTPSSARATQAPPAVGQADAVDAGDSKMSLDMNRDEALSSTSDGPSRLAGRPAHLQIKSIKEETADSETDAPATPRSSMSIASML